jgi:hypothetical protein
MMLSTLTKSRVPLLRIVIHLDIDVFTGLNHRFIVGGILVLVVIVVGVLRIIAFFTFVFILVTLLLVLALTILVGPLGGLLGGFGLIENNRPSQSA